VEGASVTVQLPPNVLNVTINVNYGNYQYDVTSKVPRRRLQ